MRSTGRISRPWAQSALRALAAISMAGALSGVLVGGIGGRLAMMLLAQLNPQVRGVKSDDGFVMGQFRVGPTLSLLIVCCGLGVLGAAIYAVVRGLMIGPRWFEVLSISGGPAAENLTSAEQAAASTASALQPSATSIPRNPSETPSTRPIAWAETPLAICSRRTNR